MILNTKSGMIASGTVGSNNGIKTTANGKTYCTFSIAAARENNETVWVNCKAWRNIALIADTLQKGDCVAVYGRLEESDYNGKHYKTLVADCITPSPIPVGDAYEPPEHSGESTGAGAMDGADDDGDSLPF